MFLILLLLSAVYCLKDSIRFETENIPTELMETDSTEELLSALISKKFKSCRAVALFNPDSNQYMFKHPGSTNPSLSDFTSLPCDLFSSRSDPYKTVYFFPFETVTDILDYNDDSIFSNSLLEIPSLKGGLEVSLYPVKYYQPEKAHYSQTKIPLCFDAVKFLGIGEDKTAYLLLSTGDKHYPLKCHSRELNKYLRYSSYCDEFCSEDFIYFASDLAKCKCHFFNYRKTSNKAETQSQKQNFDRYEVFANTYTTFQKLKKYNEKYNNHLRYYFHVLQFILVFQIFYYFYISRKIDAFSRISSVFFSFLSLIVYFIVKNTVFHWETVLESLGDVFPLSCLLFLALKGDSKEEILVHSILAFFYNGDYILKETKVTLLEITVRAVTLTVFTQLNYFYSIQPFKKVVVIKLALEFLSRLLLFLVQNGVWTNFSIPMYILLGFPRELSFLNNILIFQLNYLRILPYFEHLRENWFVEALTHNEAKNIMLFLVGLRYFCVVFIAYFVISSNKMKVYTEMILNFKVGSIIFKICLLPSELLSELTQMETLPSIRGMSFIFAFSCLFNDCLLTRNYVISFVIHCVLGVLLDLILDQEETDRLQACVQSEESDNSSDEAD